MSAETLLYGLAILFAGIQVGIIIAAVSIARQVNGRAKIGLLWTWLCLASLLLAWLV